jgi:hypothetical protein|tara:strand:+ start:15079 stop:15216 length:138 start_codon:yes stop_codon:yes gene_type:complete
MKLIWVPGGWGEVLWLISLWAYIIAMGSAVFVFLYDVWNLLNKGF